MNLARLALNNLKHDRRRHVAVALSVAAAVAILTGALVVGDSVRGTLRHLALDRLGQYDEALVAPRFFRAALANELAKTAGFQDHFAAAVPAIILPGTVEFRHPDGRIARANGVTVIGCTQEFWWAGDPKSGSGNTPTLVDGQIVLNAALAGPDQLGIDPQEMLSQSPAASKIEVLLRVGAEGGIPADSPLGRKLGTVRSQPLNVSAVIPSRGLANFSLLPNQHGSLCAMVDLATLQALLKQPGKVNAILLAGKLDAAKMSTARWLAADVAAKQWLAGRFRPLPVDYGLTMSWVVLGVPSQRLLNYDNLTSDRMLLDPALDERIKKFAKWVQVQPALTYLANDLECRGRHVPYSTITAIDANEKLGPYDLGHQTDKPATPTPDLRPPTSDLPAPLADDEIVLVDWAANDLQAKPGDKIRVAYFDPETTHGDVHERSTVFKLRAVVPLAPPGEPPLKTNDPHLTPELAGVTDRKAIATWDPPFPFHPERVRPRDEQYWQDYRTTPKAYVSLNTGRKLWASRFGQTTSVRIPPEASKWVIVESPQFWGEPLINLHNLLTTLAIAPTEMGFDFRPVKREALFAASGTTPFDVLFLLFSTFLIAAALMLLAILFQLGIETRAGQIGLLLAVGLNRRQITRLLLIEGVAVAAVGGLVGILLGVGYAWLLLYGLRSWWISAVSTPLLSLEVTARSLAIGYAAGVAVSAAAIWATVRSIRHQKARALLAGSTSVGPTWVAGATPQIWGVAPVTRVSAIRIAAIAMLAVSALLAIAASRLGADAQAGAFFGCGGLTLAAALGLVWAALRSPGHYQGGRFGLTLGWFARRNVARHPGRSALAIGLTAAAAFLIVAVSAFRLDVTASGSGGFNLVAESSAPIYRDLGTPAGRFDLGIIDADETRLADCTFAALRVHAGDDASCRNLYRPRQPRILGVSPALAAQCRGPNRFDWAAAAPTSSSADTDHAERPSDLRPPTSDLTNDDTPWRLLEQPLPHKPNDPPRVPVILDENTARYSLNLWGGIGDTLTVQDSRGEKVTLEVVALLKNSIFQGSLLVGEKQFLQLFPDTGGYRYFLIRTPPGQAAAVSDVLEDRLGDYGFDATPASRRLAELLAVQNTYLATFQSLGWLGLLLGTFGLAAVQLRSVLERRGELALLRAVGFRRRRLAALVLFEHGLLLIGGLAIGIGAALLAIWPHLANGRAHLPWQWLGLALGAVLLVGLAAGLSAVRAMLRAAVGCAAGGVTGEEAIHWVAWAACLPLFVFFRIGGADASADKQHMAPTEG